MLQDKFEKKIKPLLLKDLDRTNVMSVPRLEKIVVGMGVGKNKESKVYVSEAIEELRQLTGQMPVSRLSRADESGFKLRKGEVVGLQVTLRGSKMWEFFERLVNVVLPRVRDFRGVPRDAFDGHGNYNLGIVEHQVFPELDPNKLKQSKGLQVTIVTPPEVGDEEAYLLLDRLGMPFVKE